jgi:hypothetical protein
MTDREIEQNSTAMIDAFLALEAEFNASGDYDLAAQVGAAWRGLSVVSLAKLAKIIREA